MPEPTCWVRSTPASPDPGSCGRLFVSVLLRQSRSLWSLQISRNAPRGLLLAGMKRARGFLKLARRYRESKELAADNASRNQLSALENSYLTLAKSSQALRRSLRLQKALERRHGKWPVSVGSASLIVKPRYAGVVVSEVLFTFAARLSRELLNQNGPVRPNLIARFGS